MKTNEVTATIKTFMRPEKFYSCLECAINAGIKNFVIGYDGPEKYKKEHEEICNHFPHVDIQFLTFPFNLGLSAVRNAMNREVTTEFLFQLDDDNFVPNNVLSILPFLDGHSEWGGIGIGWLQPAGTCLPMIDAWDAEIINNYLFRTFNDSKYLETSHWLAFMYPFDFISNNGLFRTKVFRDFEWDEKFKIWGEHEDFFLRVKFESDWKFAHCLSLYAIHAHGGDDEFISYRMGLEMKKSKDYFLKKWNLKGIAPERKDSMLLEGDFNFTTVLKRNNKFKEQLKNNKLSPRNIIKY